MRLKQMSGRIDQSHARRKNAAESSRSTFAILLAATLWVVTVALMHLAGGLRHSPLSEGQRAPNAVIAQIDFESVDLSSTALARRQAADTVTPVFSINLTALQSAQRAVDEVFDRIIKERADVNLTNATQTIEAAGITLRIRDIKQLAPDGKEEEVRTVMQKTLSDVWTQGIISVSEKESLFHGVAATGQIVVAEPDLTLRPPVPISELYSSEEATRAAITRIRHQLSELEISEAILRNLVRALILPNLSFDATTTELARQQAQRSVQPVLKVVRAGTTLINQGDRISAQQIEDWRNHERRLNELESSRDRRFRATARAVLLLFALVICVGMLRILRPDMIHMPSRLVLIAVVTLLASLGFAGLLYLAYSAEQLRVPVVEYLLPLAFAPLMITILIGPSVAMVVGAWTSFAAAVMFDNSFSVLVMGLLVTLVVAYCAHDIRRRARMVRVGLLIGLAQSLYGLCIAALQQYPLDVTGLQIASALGTGLATALAALILLPLFESLFKITTDITLLELSDMGHPLLQRLAIEAPGTYHHSLMVANLAQAAAAEVNANSLLIRVCAYFHDIGKLTKPEFFVENTQFRENPHDDLTPSMSTLVIISHVKEGVAMARRAKLPAPLIDAIEQHHGTHLVSFFYHRARTLQSESANGSSDRPVNEADFRYPGPKPQTREMGILLLADGVEAASRSMEKPTPSRIEHLVNEIVDARLQDHQLDDCALTFAELKVIKQSFIFTLTNMLHGRVPYPKDEDRTNEQAARHPSPASPVEGVRPVDHDQSPST